ncbi:MAG TPA: TerC family protein [Pyrinomonadaceae bacterium]|nr:TerC family protein [Pyrinomonadaceae bacterium]
MEWVADPHSWIAFLTLVALEIVLGIDNIIFISILSGKLPAEQQPRARFIGLGLALIIRVLLLFSLSWVIGLTAPLFTVFEQAISGRDLILLAGGLFLMGKATFEIHENLEGEEGHASRRVKAGFISVIIQIIILDAVFSLDSVITAIGMVENVAIMISAVVVSIAFMMFFAAPVGTFVAKHPTIKMLALSFLILIGLNLIVEAFDVHVPKGYIYFAMGFSVFVELLNMRLRKKSSPVQLHERYAPEAANPPQV